MPKKINGAVELRNYVPKGNGYPSGEHGDKETGGNVHWKPISEGEFDEFVKSIGPVDVAF